MAKYSQLAFVFPAATVAGWLVGVALDRWLHTTWLYLAGILLGIAAGFIELIRSAMRDTKFSTPRLACSALDLKKNRAMPYKVGWLSACRCLSMFVSWSRRL